MSTHHTPQEIARRWTLSCWALLLVLVVFRQLAGGISLSALGWAVLFALPLLLCIAGLVRGRRYTYKWATLCVLPYFVVGITESVANANLRTWALLMLGLSLLWFFAMLAFLRVTSDEPVAE